MPLVALVLASVLDAVDLAAPEPLGGTAARYLPIEGQRTVSLGVDGVETVVEHARAVGVEELLAAPPTVAAELLAALGDDGATRAQWWRASRVDDAGQRSTALHVVGEKGVALAATWGGALGLVFVPPLPVLPAEVAAGDAWRASGSALAGGTIAYEGSFSAWRPDGAFSDTLGRDLPLTGGCIGVDADLALSEPGGDFARRLVESTLWCPGRGAVWSRADLDGVPVGFAEVRPAVLDPQPREAEEEPEPVASSGSLGWGGGGALERTVDDPFFGPAPASGQYAVAPASTADGRLVMANDRGDDVEVWRLEGATATRAWAGHPGGTIVAVGVVGDLVVATTAQRRVVAYDAVGRRLWSRALDELVLGPPTALAVGAGAPDVVVATRGGDLVRLRAATGEIVWSRSIGADARRGPIVADGVVLVADERERLTALDGASGATRWRAELGLVDALAASADAVAVLVDARSLAVLGLADGQLRDEHPLGGLARGLVVADGRAIALTEEGLLAVPLEATRAGEGRPPARWSGTGGDALGVVGDAVAVVRGAAVDLLEAATGRRADTVDVDPAAVGAARAAVALGDAVVLVDSDGALQRWGVRQGSAR